MPRLSFKTFFLVSTAVLTLLVFVNLQKQRGFPDTRFPLEKGTKVKLDAEGATQTFVASRNGLSGVNILFGGAQIKNGGTLSFALFDETCTRQLRKEQRFVDTLNADNSTAFLFSRIPDSLGKTFCLTFDFVPEKGSNKAAVFVIPNTLPHEKLFASINGEEYPGQSLAIRPVYQNGSVFADLAELDQRISQYKPWFLKGTFLAALASLSIGFSFAFLILAVFLREENATHGSTPDTSRRNS